MIRKIIPALTTHQEGWIQALFATEPFNCRSYIHKCHQWTHPTWKETWYWYHAVPSRFPCI